MNQTNYRWQIKDMTGRVIADYLTWPAACDVLSVLQQHNLKVTLRLVEGDAQ
ncbi:hypothetical protein [Paraburkholderia ferrariae]|uniref:Uncharacterized protein n=1 Tax=Paraburkholderia ferrariae TaxID=386056 RepID=A0ABU9RJC7_9BURK